MHPKLSFEQAPPISVPFRFFLTAPLFGMAAGTLLALKGGGDWGTRWNGDVLVFTHLLAAGFMLQAMSGALLQFVPVATGGNIWRPRWVAHWLHPLLILATLLLVSAFGLSARSWFMPAGGLFLAALLPFLWVSGWAMFHTPAQGATLPVLRLALLGLLLTLSLGVLLLGVLAGHWGSGFPEGWSLPVLVNIHAAWGLGAWALMLVMGVSYLVVPMFQLTPAYPVWVARNIPRLLLAVLVLWALLPFYSAAPPIIGIVIQAVGLGLMVTYAGVTLWLQKRRRRKVTDITLIYWRVAMAALLAVFFFWVALRIVPSWGEHPRALLGPGILILMGGFVSAINGMLYKIVPFLIWLHWQQLGQMKTLPPNMKQIIAEKDMRGQLVTHLLATLLLLAMLVWPLLAHLAGLAVVVSFAWLEWNLIRAVRLYQDFRKQVLAARSVEPVASV